MLGLTVTQVLSLFLRFMNKYPELLEFPTGVQNIMTLFYPDIHYDIPLIKEVMERLVQNFNIVMAKDQFMHKIHDENEEPYVEYLQPVYLILMATLKVGLQPTLSWEEKQNLIGIVRKFFQNFTSVSCYI